MQEGSTTSVLVSTSSSGDLRSQTLEERYCVSPILVIEDTTKEQISSTGDQAADSKLLKPAVELLGITKGGSKYFGSDSSLDGIEFQTKNEPVNITDVSNLLRPVVVPKNLHVSNIPGYIPNITNNHIHYVLVTLRIECFVRGFDDISQLPTNNNDFVSPIELRDVKGRRKSHTTSVVVGSYFSRRKKVLSVFRKTMVLPPNSKTNIRPNNVEEEESDEDEEIGIRDYLDNVELEKFSFLKELTETSFNKNKKSAVESKKWYSYHIEEFHLVKNSKKPSKGELKAKNQLEKATLEAPHLVKSLGALKPVNVSKTDNTEMQMLTRGIGPFVPRRIHQIVLTVKQMRNVKDMLEHIDQEADSYERYEELLRTPDVFLLMRDEPFVATLNKRVLGMSPFSYAALKQRYDVIKGICDYQSHNVYNEIMMDIDQLRFVVDLQDHRVLEMILRTANAYIRSQAALIEARDTYNLSPNDSILNRRENMNLALFGSKLELEKHTKKCIIKNLVSINNVKVMGPMLRVQYPRKYMAKVAAMMSKDKILKYLLENNMMKWNDYFSGGTVLHWAVLNRSLAVIAFAGENWKRSLKVSTTGQKMSRLIPFQDMTAYDMACIISDFGFKMLPDDTLSVREALQPNGIAQRCKKLVTMLRRKKKSPSVTPISTR